MAYPADYPDSISLGGVSIPLQSRSEYNCGARYESDAPWIVVKVDHSHPRTFGIHTTVFLGKGRGIAEFQRSGATWEEALASVRDCPVIACAIQYAANAPV